MSIAMGSERITTKSISKDLVIQSLKTILLTIIVLSIFVLFNMLYIILRNIEYFHVGTLSYFKLAIQILIGLIFIIWSLLMVRSYILIKIMSVVYKYLTPFFKKLSVVIIEKVYDKSLNLSKGRHISRSVNIGHLLKNSYANKVPRIIQKAINFLLNQIPFVDFLSNMNKEVKVEGSDYNKESISNNLYIQMDRYIQDSILKKNNLYCFLWMFPLNIVLQISLDFFY